MVWFEVKFKKDRVGKEETVGVIKTYDLDIWRCNGLGVENNPLRYSG
jgi:hypothetical protein